MTNEDVELVFKVATQYANDTDADVIVYSGSIEFPFDRKIVACCPQPAAKRRANCLLILATWGGDPHAAFRIARALQQRYKKVIVFIPSYCKSAGTLIALGAHELVVGDFGELGPLDIQVARRDELGEMSSGLVVNEALVSLQKRSIATFTAIFKNLKEESGGQITLKTAMQTAREMTVGLMAPIFSQIEPMHLGELTRAMKITEHYGARLSAASKNLKRDALQSLVAAYPSHYIDIDRQEAQTLFNNVREPSEAESAMAQLMHELLAVPPDEAKKTYVAPLSQPQEADHESAHDRGHSARAGGKDAEPPGRPRTRRSRKRSTGRPVDGANGREPRPS